MNLFQMLALAIVVLFLALNLQAIVRGRVSRRAALPGLVVWLCAALAILWPESTAIVARKLGVQRGADLVSYLAAIAVIAGFTVVSLRLRRLSRSLTLLVREQALAQAELEDLRREPEVIQHS